MRRKIEEQIMLLVLLWKQTTSPKKEKLMDVERRS